MGVGAAVAMQKFGIFRLEYMTHLTIRHPSPLYPAPIHPSSVLLVVVVVALQKPLSPLKLLTSLTDRRPDVPARRSRPKKKNLKRV